MAPELPIRLVPMVVVLVVLLPSSVPHLPVPPCMALVVAVYVPPVLVSPVLSQVP